MIMTVAEFRQFVTTDEVDQVLEAKLLALELLIRSYTNNNFQVRSFRATADARGKTLTMLPEANRFKAGDTLQITDSVLNAGLVNVRSSIGSAVTVEEDLNDETAVTVTKVVYPADIKQGVVRMLQWQLDNGDKVGVQSETISRHSVTYFNMDVNNTVMGYPISLLGFLSPYMKARFGRGLRV